MSDLTRNKGSVHFIGIGGIGASALARYYLGQGFRVSGSDLSPSPILEELEKEGARVKIGHSKKFNSRLDLVVYSQAIPDDDPELSLARELGISIKTYPQALGELTRQFKTVTVAGSHGKSTTTALLSLILVRAGLDPTVIIGTKLKEFDNKNFRSGRSGILVIEADEYQDAFLNYSPTLILITNIDREHLDYAKHFGNVKKSFLKFISNLREDGILVLNQDDPPLLSLRPKINREIDWFSLTNDKGVGEIKSVIKIPGRHNLSNAFGALTAARRLGVSENMALEAIGDYRGAWRRMEYKGELKTKNSKLKTYIYDDYAHHPTEIKATLAAFKEAFPDYSLICVFQPHQSRRLEILFKDFTESFDKADALILLDVYRVIGRDSLDPKINSEKLAEAIRKRRTGPKEIIHLSSKEKLKETVARFVPSLTPAMVVMMGAGDIVDLTSGLLE